MYPGWPLLSVNMPDPQQNFRMCFTPNIRVGDVKVAVNRRYGYPVSSQTVMFSGRPLRNQRILCRCRGFFNHPLFRSIDRRLWRDGDPSVVRYIDRHFSRYGDRPPRRLWEYALRFYLLLPLPDDDPDGHPLSVLLQLCCFVHDCAQVLFPEVSFRELIAPEVTVLLRQ